MKIAIKDITCYLPATVVTNDDLIRQNPDWDLRRISSRLGVERRNIARPDETALDLAYAACETMFRNHNELSGSIDAIIFCTQSPDYIMPPNSCILHGRLNLSDRVLTFDYNLACSGYIYGLVLAQGLLKSAMAKNILLITSDTYSKYIHPRDRSARVLFGDGAAVTWLGEAQEKRGLIDIICSTQGKNFEKFIIPAGGSRMPKTAATCVEMTDENGNTRTLENIHMDGMGIMEFILDKIPRQVRILMDRNNLTVDQIDHFIFHQANKIVLDSLVRVIDIPPEKMFQNIMNIGNTVSASIPIALYDAYHSNRIKKGDLILVSGFGVGLSWGTALLKF